MKDNASKHTVIVFSKAGHSRRIAREIAEYLGVAPVEVTTPRYKLPILGWIAACLDGMRGAPVPLDQSLDLPDDGLVVLVGPVWAGGPASPLNTVVDMLKPGVQDVAVLLTCGDPKEQTGPLEKLETRLGRPLKATHMLSNAVQDTSEAQPRLAAFLNACIGKHFA
ncbi:MAG: hypothetical protein QNJ20_17210 [Paracoccaceae bacterium]|nr:hypothetical protein [Paracoccaceae bacterium]